MFRITARVANNRTSVFAKRSVSALPEELETGRPDKRAAFIKELLTKVLTDPRNETKITKELKLLQSLTTNKQEFAELMRLSARLGAQLDFAGHQEVGQMTKKAPVRVAVTGAAGNIGYALLPRIISGEMLGPDTPVILHLIERPDALKALEGVVMELEDCAFPLCRGIVATSDISVGFKNVDYTFLVGAKPRGPGMERGDLLKDNANIFKEQGAALSDVASSNCLTLVVGNPANTNALVAASNAAKLKPQQFSAMMRLDHDRAMAQVALKTKSLVADIKNVAIWGNHSATQYPDVSFATVAGRSAREAINDDAWIKNTFIPTVQKRGAAIIDARGASSAASAADAALKHMRDWALGSNGEWVSMAVPSDGSYGVKEGVYCSYPVVCTGEGKYQIVKDLKLDAFSQDMFNKSVKELFDERSAVSGLLGSGKKK